MLTLFSCYLFWDTISTLNLLCSRSWPWTPDLASTFHRLRIFRYGWSIGVHWTVFHFTCSQGFYIFNTLEGTVWDGRMACRWSCSVDAGEAVVWITTIPHLPIWEKVASQRLEWLHLDYLVIGWWFLLGDKSVFYENNATLNKTLKGI